jgi:transposase-like protein
MTTTAEQRERIIALRERNWSKASIATELGVSLSTVSHWCLVSGAEAKKLPPPMSRRAGPVLRGGRLIYPFTEADDAEILALERAGRNYSEIARRLTALHPERPRTPAAIKYRLLTLARYEERYGGAPVLKTTKGGPGGIAPLTPASLFSTSNEAAKVDTGALSQQGAP